MILTNKKTFEKCISLEICFEPANDLTMMILVGITEQTSSSVWFGTNEEFKMDC